MTSAGSNAIRVPSPCTTRTCGVGAKFAVARAASSASWYRLTETSREPGRMKTYRFGVNLGPSRSRAEWVEKARKLEDLGYSTLTVLGRLIRN
jgi:hypothetical protein